MKLATQGLLDFTRFTKPDYEVNWHHRVLCGQLDRLVSGEIKRLMVCMPPRHGKSEVVSRRFPAYILGRQPNAQIISCSYGADLASRMNRDVQRIMESPEYGRLFPLVKLNPSNVRTASGGALRNSDVFEVPGHSGVYRSAGVGGGITGMGCHYAILDDPIRNRADADSLTYRERLWEWYCSTFLTRLEKGGAVLLCLTRWHEDDVAGRLLRLAEANPSADQWTVVCFPAEAEDGGEDDPRRHGEALWPNKYDTEALAKIKAGIGSYQWASLYQQRPAPAAGGIFKTRWWRFWFRPDDPLPPVNVRLDNGELVTCPVVALPKRFDEESQSWDMTFKGLEASKGGSPDFVVGQAWGRHGADCYLQGQTRGQWDLVETLDKVLSFSTAWPRALTKLIEDKANGPAVISTLRHKLGGLIAVEPNGDKTSRARAATPIIESGNVYLPHPTLAPWVWDFIHECATFPGGRNDDQVDAMTQQLLRWTSSPIDVTVYTTPLGGPSIASKAKATYGSF